MRRSSVSETTERILIKYVTNVVEWISFWFEQARYITLHEDKLQFHRFSQKTKHRTNVGIGYNIKSVPH
jgi:hypothetical protein